MSNVVDLKRVEEIESEVNVLKEVMGVFQQNINNNITWFYMLLTILVAVLAVVLGIWVKQRVESGIKKGIEIKISEFEDQIEKLKSEVRNINPESEKGTWIPTLNGQPNYVSQSGIYYRVGEMVILWFDIRVNGKDKSLEKGLQIAIKGLPFIPKEDSFGDIKLINRTRSESETSNTHRAVVKRNDLAIRVETINNHYSSVLTEVVTLDQYELSGMIVYLAE